MNAYDLAAEAVANPSVLAYIPHAGFHDHVLHQLRTGHQTIKAQCIERDGNTVTVWLWVAAATMTPLSDQQVAHLARTEVGNDEHVHRIRANAYRGDSPAGGEVLEYVYRVESA